MCKLSSALTTVRQEKKESELRENDHTLFQAFDITIDLATDLSRRNGWLSKVPWHATIWYQSKRLQSIIVTSRLFFCRRDLGIRLELLTPCKM